MGKVIAVLMQSVVVQALGLVFFYLLSVHLTTEAFGLLSWANAVSMLLTTVTGFGLEQVVMRRVAAGNATSGWAATAFTVHSLAGNAIVLCILVALSSFFKNGHRGIALLPALFIVQAVAMQVVPLKLLLNAKARYAPYAIIAILSNAGRIAAAVFYLQNGHALSVATAAVIMLTSNVAELAATAVYIWVARLQPPLLIPLRGYRRLLREAAPQYLSVLFDISLARADWILLGILSTDAATGYYTFAYRAFEMLRIPAAGVGLLLMPRIAPLLNKADRLDDHNMSRIRHFLRIEMWVVCAAALLMNVLWVPLVGQLTHGRYGAANAPELQLLSLCLPLHFAINLMWILAFASRKYAALARITLISSVVNISANVALIPLFGGRGAALAFLAASVVQAMLYYSLLKKNAMELHISPVFISSAAAAGCFMLQQYFAGLLPAALLVTFSLAGYVVATYLFGQWRVADRAFIKQILTTG